MKTKYTAEASGLDGGYFVIRLRSTDIDDAIREVEKELSIDHFGGCQTVDIFDGEGLEAATMIDLHQ